MTTPSGPAPGAQPPAPMPPSAARFRSIWDFLTRPSPHVVDGAARRQAQFLSGLELILAFMLVGGLLLIGPTQPAAAPFLVVVSFVIACAYLLSRTRYYRIGAFISAVHLVGFTFVNLATLSYFNGAAALGATAWIVIPLLIGATFLSFREMGLLISGYALALIVAPFAIPGLTPLHMGRAFFYFGSVSGLTLLFRQQIRLVESDRIGIVEQERNVLEQRVAERTREMAATNRELNHLLEIHRHLLSAGNSLLINLDVDSLLQNLAEAAQKVLGFELVVISLVADNGSSVRVAAQAGALETTADKLADSGVEMTWGAFLDALRQEHRVGQNSYFMSVNGEESLEQDPYRPPPRADHARSSWHPDDALLGLIMRRDGQAAGIISVDEPADRLRPDQETIQALDLFSNLAAVAIENSILYERLQEELSEREHAEQILAVAHVSLQKRSAELAHANRELQTLLYVISHDLKEPLRTVRNFSRLVAERNGINLDPRGLDYLQRVVRAGDHLETLIEDILVLSRVDSMTEPAEPVSGGQIVNEVLHQLDERIRETGAVISVAEDLPDLTVDRSWAVRALVNLIGNALKFAPPRQAPVIEIEAYTGPEGIGFSVLDRGPGVPEASADKIFQLFHRGANHRVEGTGAGLAIVRRIAQRHGGSAWYTSRAGGGSIFTVTLCSTSGATTSGVRAAGVRAGGDQSTSAPPAADEFGSIALQ